MIELNKFKTLEELDANISGDEDSVVNVCQLFLVCDIINNNEFNQLIKTSYKEAGFATWEGFFVESRKIKRLIQDIIKQRTTPNNYKGD